jgi:hypothetical protein
LKGSEGSFFAFFECFLVFFFCWFFFSPPLAFNPRDIALVTSRDEETKKLNKKLWEALDARDAASVEEYLEKVLFFLLFFRFVLTFWCVFQGAQVNYKKWVYGEDLCFTPLHFAVFNGLTDVMKVLFKYNCDVLLRTPAGEIAKDLAIEKVI